MGLALLALVAFLPATVRLAPASGPTPVRPLPPRPARLQLIGALKLEPFGKDAHGDVATYRNLAFVGKWSGPCPGGGVDVIDISEPATPTLLSHTPEHLDTSMEVMRPLRIGTRDVLAIGLQDCHKPTPGVTARAGLELVDITDARNPSELSFFDVDAFGRQVVGVHELDVTRAPDGRSLALLAVPGLEPATADDSGHGGKGDLLIVDISDPTRPVLTGSWGVLGDPALGLDFYRTVRRGNDARTLLHSVRAGHEGTIAYLSYWDAGVIILDIADPSQPHYLGRTTYAPTAEGNAHSVAEADGGRLIVQADEVTSPFQLRLTSNAFRGERPAAPGNFSRPIGTDPAQSMSGPIVFVGRGCGQDAYLADPAGKIALVERGACRFDEKVARAQQARATGAVIFDDQANTDEIAPMDGSRHVVLPNGSAVDVDIPAVLVSRDTGLGLRDSGPPTTASAASTFTGWGYLTLWDVRDRRHPVQVGEFATPEVFEPSRAGAGLWTVHNPEVRGSTLLASWYSDGVRAIDISRPWLPREIAAWTGAGAPADAPPLSIWGVAFSGSLVLASDRNFGLYVLQLSR
ncbi:MAG TPA: PA domain-containing protein [Candidatus Dormibacteraeota bacterium]|nr:PA domain-containing protein [Candidatus Dormibacteraeota bacterium]